MIGISCTFLVFVGFSVFIMWLVCHSNWSLCDTRDHKIIFIAVGVKCHSPCLWGISTTTLEVQKRRFPRADDNVKETKSSQVHWRQMRMWKRRMLSQVQWRPGERAEDFQSYKQPFFDQQKPSTGLWCALIVILKAGWRVVLEMRQHRRGIEEMLFSEMMWMFQNVQTWNLCSFNLLRWTNNAIKKGKRRRILCFISLTAVLRPFPSNADTPTLSFPEGFTHNNNRIMMYLSPLYHPALFDH